MRWIPLIFLLLSLPPSWDLAKITKIVVTFVKSENGSLVPVIKRQLVDVEDEHSSGFNTSAIAGIFLGIFFVVGFSSNIILISAIASSVILKRLPFNVIIMNLAAIALIEIVINFTSSFAYLITEPWHFGSIPCWINSSFMEFTPILYTIFIVILVLDRLIALRSPSSYKKNLNLRRYRILILLCWLIAFVIVTPLASGIISSLPFPYRYSCQIMDPNSRIFGLSVGVAIYLLSSICMIVFTILICLYINNERKLERKFQRDRFGGNKKYSSHTAFFIANAHLWNEIRNIFVVMGILGVYILFLYPYIILTKFDQILGGFGSGYRLEFYRNQTLPQYKVFNETDENGKNISTKILTKRDPLDTPEVNEDFLGPHDTAIVWMRFFHFILLPFVILILHKECRNKTKTLLRCCFVCRPNSVENNDSPRPVSAYIRQRQRELIKKQRRFKNSTNYSVPVLFVTSEGLHLRILDENFSGFSEHKSILEQSLETKSQWTVDPEFITELCDMYPNFPGLLSRKKTPLAEISEDDEKDTEEEDNQIPFINIETPKTPETPSPPRQRKVQFLSKIEEFSDIEIMKGTESSKKDLLDSISDFEVPPRKVKTVKRKRKKSRKNRASMELNPLQSPQKRWKY